MGMIINSPPIFDHSPKSGGIWQTQGEVFDINLKYIQLRSELRPDFGLLFFITSPFLNDHRPLTPCLQKTKNNKNHKKSRQSPHQLAPKKMGPPSLNSWDPLPGGNSLWLPFELPLGQT